MESKTKVAEAFKSITSDNGSEFSGLSDFESLVDVYFCHPYSSFERGSNERHNGILDNSFQKVEVLMTLVRMRLCILLIL